jgi:cysteine synthase A
MSTLLKAEELFNMKRMGMCSSVADAVGGTPLVALDRLCKGLKSRVAAKLEFYSPGGSVKDRPALEAICDAEKKGRLKKGQPVIELTSGNMGAGLAWACAVKGYQFIAVMSTGNSPERRQMIAAFGATVVLVPQVKGGVSGQVTHEDMEAVEKKTQELVKKHKAFRPDQFSNPSSVVAHFNGTGREIWEQTAGKVTHFVSFVGSSGTLIGTAKFLKERNPKIVCICAEPAVAPFLAGKPIRGQGHRIQGGGYALLPGIFDEDVVDGFITVSDDEAIDTARALAAKEGIFSGFSSGANVAAAMKIARHVPKGSLIVTVCCDTGLKYLSTGLFPA